MKCPSCETDDLRPVELSRQSLHLFQCDQCGELVQQLQSGVLLPLGRALDAAALGDDRVKMAISKSAPATLSSFMEMYELMMLNLSRDLHESSGSLRTLLAQILNRMDHGIGKLAAMAMIDDNVVDALTSLREARDLISTLPRRARGVKPTEKT